MLSQGSFMNTEQTSTYIKAEKLCYKQGTAKYTGELGLNNEVRILFEWEKREPENKKTILPL